MPSGWNIQSSGGAIQGVSPNDTGVFLFGYSINIFMPGSAPGGTAALISPYLNAATALTQFWPKLAQGVTDIRIVKVIHDASLPTFTSSGTLQIAYRYKGKPWVGMATIGTGTGTSLPHRSRRQKHGHHPPLRTRSRAGQQSQGQRQIKAEIRSMGPAVPLGNSANKSTLTWIPCRGPPTPFGPSLSSTPTALFRPRA